MTKLASFVAVVIKVYLIWVNRTESGRETLVERNELNVFYSTVISTVSFYQWL